MIEVAIKYVTQRIENAHNELMAQAEFSVHLGGGLYMDSNGVLSHGPKPGKPVYATPGGGLPVNLDTLQKTFSGLAKALPNADDPKSRKKFDEILDGIGMLAEHKDNLIGTLQAIGAVASVIGSVVPIVGAALAVLTLLLGLFKSGPSALEVLIMARFDDLVRQIKALEIIINQHDLRTLRAPISKALAALKNYADELQHTPPSPTNLLLRQQDMRAEVGAANLAARNLLDSSTWLTGFSELEHKWVWPWITHRLFTFPRTGAPQRAVFPGPGSIVFDHALMVPLCSFAVTSFLTVLRALAPEFRSTKENREDLWEFAAALETLVENMRREGLARTVYTAADFGGGGGGGLPWGLSPEEVIDFFPFSHQPLLAPGSTRWAVGALDLRVHNDAYFTPGFTAGPIQLLGDQYAKQGLLNVRWIPPAVLERYDEDGRRRYRIINPEECAQAANAQAEADYADLLYSSGYLNLIHLIAVLRNEATDPDRSQTVRTDAWLRRKPGTAAAVNVESEPILLTGVISAPAQRVPQEYRATVSLTTQPLGRNTTLNYRIWLRTLGATFSPNGRSWNEQEYRYYHQVDYVDDAAHPGCKKLVTSTGIALGEVKLAEGQSDPEFREAHGTAILKAITFDWWIPLKGLSLDKFDPREAARITSLRAAGWESDDRSAPSSSQPPHGQGPLPGSLPGTGSLWDRNVVEDDVTFSDVFAWIDAVEPSDGQHRKAAESEVHLDYKLRWRGDRMTIALKNRPSDRNYVVHVVVEETLGSGAVLHTTQRIPVIGQLTYVPQSYFDQETEAVVRLAKTARDFARRYAISVSDVPRGPSDPGDPRGIFGLEFRQIASDSVLRELELGGFTTPQALERVATRAAQYRPAAALLRQAFADAHVPKATVEAFFRAAKAESKKDGRSRRL